MRAVLLCLVLALGAAPARAAPDAGKAAATPEAGKAAATTDAGKAAVNPDVGKLAPTPDGGLALAPIDAGAVAASAEGPEPADEEVPPSLLARLADGGATIGNKAVDAAVAVARPGTPDAGASPSPVATASAAMPGARDGGVVASGPAGKAPAGGVAARDAGAIASASLSPDGGRVRVGGEAAFLFAPEPKSLTDGTIYPPPTDDQPKAAYIKYAAQQLEQGLVELKRGQQSLAAVDGALQKFFKTSGGENPKQQRDDLARMAATTLEQGRLAYLAAADHERRRLTWLIKAVREAEDNAEANPLPGLDVLLVAARQAALRDGKVRAAIEARFKGYKGLMMGIVAWVDGDTFLSLEQLKQGVAGIPDQPLAHLYLGYVQYILENVNEALAEWRKALDLDPTNEVIKRLIADHLHERK